MKQKIAAKARSQAGETLAETLISLLVAALALVMLAGAVAAAGRIVDRSKTAMKDYYTADAKVAGRTGSGTPGTATLAVVAEGGPSMEYNVTTYKNDKADEVVAYAYEP